VILFSAVVFLLLITCRMSETYCWLGGKPSARVCGPLRSGRRPICWFGSTDGDRDIVPAGWSLGAALSVTLVRVLTHAGAAGTPRVGRGRKSISGAAVCVCAQLVAGPSAGSGLSVCLGCASPRSLLLAWAGAHEQQWGFSPVKNVAGGREFRAVDGAADGAALLVRIFVAVVGCDLYAVRRTSWPVWAEWASGHAGAAETSSNRQAMESSRHLPCVAGSWLHQFFLFT